MATNNRIAYELSPNQRQSLSKNIVSGYCTKQWNPGTLACYTDVPFHLMQEMINCRAPIVPTDMLERIAGAFGTTITALLQNEPIHIEGNNDGLLIHAGEILRLWRQRMRIPQTKLAQEIGLSPMSISLAERGYISDHAKKIATFLAPTRKALEVILKHLTDPLRFSLNELRKRAA